MRGLITIAIEVALLALIWIIAVIFDSMQLKDDSFVYAAGVCTYVMILVVMVCIGFWRHFE